MMLSRKILFLVVSVFWLWGCNQADATSKQELLVQKNNLESEGRAFERSGDFESAILKYREAADLAIQIYGSDKGRALAFLAAVYEKQGRYKEALPIVVSLLEFHPEQVNYQDWVEELQALIKYQDSGNPKFVREYIDSYFEKYKSGLPPIAHDIDAELKITRILALNEVIGDYEAGIKFVNTILDYSYERHPEILKQENLIHAAELIDRFSKEGKNAQAYAYRILREYLLVREAFEQDKKEGTKGRVSKVLIQSTYFPW